MATKPMKTLKLPGLEDTYTFLQNDTTLAVSGKAADAKATGDALAAVQAQVDGVQAGQYPDMGAGQLLSTTGTVNPTPYTYRENASGSDRVTISQITGGTVAWNQVGCITSSGEVESKGIVRTTYGDGTASFSGTATESYTWNLPSSQRTGLKDHIIYLRGCPAGGSANTYYLQDGYNSVAKDIGNGVIYKIVRGTGTTNIQVAIGSGTAVSNIVFAPQAFDLTQMFGATVAQYFLDLETATTGAGVSLFRQMFPESYYPYNAGELVSVQTSGRKTVGFNQWDEVWEHGNISSNTGADIVTALQIRSKNYIRVMPNTTYYFKSVAKSGGGYAYYYDKNKAFVVGGISITRNSSFTTPAGVCYMRFAEGQSYGTTYNHDICINISDPARNGQYEPYSAHTYPLDSTMTLRGVPVLTEDGKVAYDGDQYAPDGTVTRRYGIVDLGTLPWTKYDVVQGTMFRSIQNYVKGGTDSTHFICPKYVTTTSANRAEGTISSGLPRYIDIIDSTYADAAAFKAAMSGVYLVYELATPTTETAAPYQEIQIAGSTEEFLPPETDTRPAAVPVGSVSLYQTNLREGLETLLDTDLAHAESIAPVQGGTASANIASGELLMRDGKLYKATQAIVAGAEIGATNTTETTVAAQLAALEARIAALEN